MQRWKTVTSSAVLAAVLGACQPTPTRVETSHPIATIGTMKISGQASYRERIALLPGAIFDVQLLDVSAMDAPATIVARQTRVLSNEQVPLPFIFEVKEHKIKTNLRYVVRATISRPDGALAWTTDTAYPVNPSLPAQDLGTLNMIRVAASDNGANLLKATHTIGDINGNAPYAGSVVSVTFARDGTVSGATGCNRFSGTYTADGHSLTIGLLATTRMMCTPELNSQEARVLGIMKDVNFWEIDQYGRFVFKTGDGRYLASAVY